MHTRHGIARQASDDVVTVGTIAKTLGISRTTAYVRARAGELPVTWRGGRFEMRRADLDQLARAATIVRPTAA